MQQAPPKFQYLPTRLHGVTTQKTTVLMYCLQSFQKASRLWVITPRMQDIRMPSVFIWNQRRVFFSALHCGTLPMSYARGLNSRGDTSCHTHLQNHCSYFCYINTCENHSPLLTCHISRCATFTGLFKTSPGRTFTDVFSTVTAQASVCIRLRYMLQQQQHHLLVTTFTTN
jgi:hypothetical protein